MLNSRDIDRLRPDVAANCRAWLELCRAAGLLVLVTGTVRDDEYQRYCYEQGTAATPYPSFHGERAGLAFDFCQNIKGQEYSDASFFQRAGELGERVGFEWGGRWQSFPDRPHLQWSEIQAMIDAAVTAARPQVYTSVEECPEWARETVQRAVDCGVLQGNQSGALHLTDDNLVNLQMLRNAGLLE